MSVNLSENKSGAIPDSTRKMKDEEGGKPVEGENKESPKSATTMFLGSAGAAVFLGLADYLASLLGDLGLVGIFSEWFGCICMFSLYHLLRVVLWFTDAERDPTEEYWSASNSMYYEPIENPEGLDGALSSREPARGVNMST